MPAQPPTEFASCSEDICNDELYPQNRITCHKCAGVNCLNANDLPTALPCRTYRPDDQCFTYFFNGVATRGCLSENENLATTCLNETLCSKCVGAGCNGKTVEDERCIVCDSEIDSNCVSNLNETMIQVCPVSPAGMGCYRFDDGGEYNLYFMHFISFPLWIHVWFDTFSFANCSRYKQFVDKIVDAFKCRCRLIVSIFKFYNCNKMSEAQAKC